MAIPKRELIAFISIADHLNLVKAGEEVSMTPSALSRMVQRLEERLDCQLLTRSKPNMILTDEGSLFYAYAQKSLSEWEKLFQAIQSQRDSLHGNVRLYCSVTASYTILTDLLMNWRRQYPDIDVNLHTGDPAHAIERVLHRKEQLVITAKPSQLHTSVAYKEISESNLVLIIPKQDCGVRKQFLNQKSKTQKDWAAFPWIIAEEGIMRERFDAWSNTLKEKPMIENRVAGHEAIVSMVSLGFGIAFVPQIVLKYSPQAEAIEVVKINKELDPISIGLCALSDELNNPLVKALWDLV